MAQPQTIIFLHIPKTAGSSLNALLQRNVPVPRIYTIHATTDADRERSVAALCAMSDERKRRIRLVHGHIPYGYHRCLPQDVRYMTVLREPVDRIISTYYYILRRPDHYLHGELNGGVSLLDYVTSDRYLENDNLQTRLLAGEQVYHNPYGSLGQAEYDLAREHLDDFAMVGLTERFDESVLLMRELLGFRKTAFRSRNVTRTRPRREEVSEEVLAAVRERNRWDLELYGESVRRFERQLGDHLPTLEAELASLRETSRKYGRLLDAEAAINEWTRRLLNSLRRRLTKAT